MFACGGWAAYGSMPPPSVPGAGAAGGGKVVVGAGTLVLPWAAVVFCRAILARASMMLDGTTGGVAGLFPVARDEAKEFGGGLPGGVVEAVEKNG